MKTTFIMQTLFGTGSSEVSYVVRDYPKSIKASIPSLKCFYLSCVSRVGREIIVSAIGGTVVVYVLVVVAILFPAKDESFLFRVSEKNGNKQWQQ
eukprot:scaffold1510_cov163-Amphora_coffeaeformis.AAC.6